jgi:hypothetical protein
MQKRLISYALLTVSTAASAIVQDVRESVARNDLSGGNAKLEEYRQRQGVTPEFLEALSWMGRGALAAKDYAKAEEYAKRTYELCIAELKKRPLDQERHLPIALGAAIEASDPRPSPSCARNSRDTTRPRFVRESRRTLTS